jgi:hypothetical protein
MFRVSARARLEGSAAAGCLREEVTFTAPMRVLFWKAWARTVLRQRAAFGPGGGTVRIDFQLVASDLIARLDGSWVFTLVRPGGGGAWPLCRVDYTFRMWPKGGGVRGSEG